MMRHTVHLQHKVQDIHGRPFAARLIPQHNAEVGCATQNQRRLYHTHTPTRADTACSATSNVTKEPGLSCWDFVGARMMR